MESLLYLIKCGTGIPETWRRIMIADRTRLGTWTRYHLRRFTGPHNTAVMKIPTSEFRLTLEIFAELCGCRQPDFLKNPSLLRLFQSAFYRGGNVLRFGLFVGRLSHEIALFHCLRAILRFSLEQHFLSWCIFLHKLSIAAPIPRFIIFGRRCKPIDRIPVQSNIS